MSDYLRPESYPLLPDWEGDTVYPAEDGRPWRKACKGCAFRTSDPQGIDPDYVANSLYRDDTLFYCVHRLDGDAVTGKHRVCASFAACKAGGR